MSIRHILDVVKVIIHTMRESCNWSQRGIYTSNTTSYVLIYSLALCIRIYMFVLKHMSTIRITHINKELYTLFVLLNNDKSKKRGKYQNFLQQNK